MIKAALVSLVLTVRGRQPRPVIREDMGSNLYYCTCGADPRESCPVCGKREPPGYWCEICGQVVTDKRCPLCGLKTRKKRKESGEKNGKK